MAIERHLFLNGYYKAFSLVPKGRHKVHICMGTACHVRGATRVLDTVEDLTGIKPGETTPDGKLTLESGECLGACEYAPCMLAGDDLHKCLDEKSADEFMDKHCGAKS